MSELDDRIADSQRVTDYLRSLQGGTTPPVEPPVDPPVEPPTEPPHADGQFLGDLTFNGARFDTQNVKGQPYSYVRFVIPDGKYGYASAISYSEYVDPQRFKTVTFTKTPGDLTAQYPALALGNSGNIRVAFGYNDPNMVTVYPGEVWYMNVANQFEDGRHTASASDSTNYAITPGVPT